jgi:pilus assembly protein Flp/PilA
MQELMKRLIHEEEGQGMVEYGLIIGLIALVLIAALTALNGGLSTIFNRMTTTLNGTNSGVSGTPSN